jgi:hypothetical protein
MRKEIFIATFIAIIMLMLPSVSAFNIPLTEDDKEELEKLIDDEDENNQETLNDIIDSDGTLDLDKLEKIYENCLLTSDFTVLNSDPWEWIIDRLGWIYITMENVMILYNVAMVIYVQLNQGINAVRNWFQSIKDFRTAWQEFKSNPIDFNTIIELITSTIDLFDYTINLIEFIVSNTLIEAIQNFADEVQNFINFLNSTPWQQPISIRGNTSGFEESITVTVKGESITTDDNFELSYTTADEQFPWFVHKCDIKAEYKEKEVTKSHYAFAMGIIESDINKGYFKDLSDNIKTLFELLIQRLQNYLSIIFHYLWFEHI